MPLLPRMFTAALTTVLAACLAVTFDGAAEASPAEHPAVASSPARTSVDLGADTVLPRRDGRAAKVRKWNLRTLYYYETLPAKWDWSLSTAAGKWNATGGRIRLVKTVKPRKAQVRIGYAAVGSAAGKATVGATKNAYVHLSTRYRNADAVNARTRITVMNVLAHELGHVLGFQHTSARCSLMAATLDVDGCNLVPASQPGYYKCRTIDTRLEQRFIAMYGGRARYPASTWCVIDPLPSALSGVTFTDGLSAPVTIHWTPPHTALAGSRLVIRRWEATSCGTAPSQADTFHPALGAGVWQDQATTQAQDACFQLQVVNRYGAGRAAQSRLLSRWVTPFDAPTIGVPTYDFDAETFTFSAGVPDGATLHARWDSDQPSTCVTSPRGGTNAAFVEVIDGQGTLASPAALPQCVSFFAHDPETGRDSAPVFVTLSDQPVPAPTLGEATWDQETHTFHASASAAAGTHLVYAEADDPSTCPGVLVGDPDDLEEPADLGNGVLAFPTTDPDQCVSFYAVANSTGHVSEPTSVVASAPLPTETPTVGPITVMDKNFYPWFEAQLGGAATGNKVGYWAFGGACPDTPPSVPVWRTQLQGELSTPNSPPDYHADYGLFPSVAAGTNCVLFTSLDWFGQQGSAHAPYSMQDRHGPVVMREYVDEGPEPPEPGDPVWDETTQTFKISLYTQGVSAIYDPTTPGTCPEPGAVGAARVTVRPDIGGVSVTPPTPSTCVTLYYEAGEGPVRLSKGVPVQLDVPQG